MVKWVVKINPNFDISAHNDFAFYYSCKMGNLEIAVWLQTLKPFLHTIKYNSDGKYKGFYIRSKEEDRCQKTKYLVWLSSL